MLVQHAGSSVPNDTNNKGVTHCLHELTCDIVQPSPDLHDAVNVDRLLHFD